ncbi:MAG TPA: arylsulfatase [Woeseiaceae bacterium]|nr:arylsulfatase [Woeseiaceae bacterium]
MLKSILFSLAAILAASGTAQAQQAAKIQPPTPTFVDREVLPIKAPYMAPITTLDARDMDRPEVFEATAPKSAPNVIVVLIDDLGFGGTSHFGGPVATPTFDQLANEGIFFNQFHSTALCSPTRQALKTGRNHHSAAMGKITELATSFPGYTGVLPDDVASIGKMLNYNGFSTAAFGKWHETAVWEISPSGPMTRWPNHQGFDEFYGFMGGETNQWTPTIYHNQNRVETPADPSYHFLTDMTTKAIEWIEFQQSLTPEKPFFVYFAPGATHAPHHVPKSYIDKQKGRFDAGWDVLRNEIYQRQLKSGVIPKGTKLAAKPDWIKDWKDLSANEQKLFARQAEVFAAFIDMTDTEIGRLVTAVEGMGEIDNTLIFYIAGDNGTSAEGVANGLYNEMTYFNAEPKGSDVEFMLQYYDKWGGSETYPHMAAGWAVAYDSPFAWTKQVASDYGGTRQGMAVHWPNGIKAKGEMRSQWHHVIDIVPTILEATGLPEPKVVDSIPQKPIEGVSMLYSFNNANAADRHTIQYFEMFGNRALYSDGWMARTIHVTPWGKPANSLEEDTWELYNVAEDFSMSTDLAKKYPGKVAELQDRFLAEARKYNVLPLDDRLIELANPDVAGRPDLMFGRTKLTLSEGMAGLLENDFINTKNTSYTIEAEIETEGTATNGVILAQGGRFGGYSLYVIDGIPVFTYNYLGIDKTRIAGNAALPSGASVVKMDFAYDGGRGGSGTVTLSVDGKTVGSGKVAKTEPNVYSADETAGVGVDHETPVSDDYTLESSKFTGTISKVTINTKPSN